MNPLHSAVISNISFGWVTKLSCLDVSVEWLLPITLQDFAGSVLIFYKGVLAPQLKVEKLAHKWRCELFSMMRFEACVCDKLLIVVAYPFH